MNKPTRPDKPSDIDALFKAQNIKAPTDLDDFILAEARQAVDDSTGNVQRVVPGGRYRSWFAAAAAVLITVGIAPMLMQSPESALEPSSIASDTASVSAEAVAEPMAMADAEQDGIRASDTAALAEQLTTESRTTAASASAELQTASSRMSQHKSASISISEVAKMSAADEPDGAASKNVAGGAAGDSAGDLVDSSAGDLAGDALGDVAADSLDGSVDGSVDGSKDVSGLRLAQPQQQESAQESTQESAELILPNQKARVTPASIAPPKPTAIPATAFGTLRSNVYRRSPESWIREMQRLESENQMAKAHIEYDQFRKRYPRFETDYRPKDLSRNSPTD